VVFPDRFRKVGFALKDGASAHIDESPPATPASNLQKGCRGIDVRAMGRERIGSRETVIGNGSGMNAALDVGSACQDTKLEGV
jgi:hypothetical protein